MQLEVIGTCMDISKLIWTCELILLRFRERTLSFSNSLDRNYEFGASIVLALMQLEVIGTCMDISELIWTYFVKVKRTYP